MQKHSEMKRIAFLTDIHLDEQFPIDNKVNPAKNLALVLADQAKRNISVISFGGDIGEATAHPYFFQALKPFRLKLIVGNHDQFEKVKEYYNPASGRNELYYKVEEDDYLYLFADTSADEISNQQLQWLASELTTHKKVILFIHHPVLSIHTAVDRVYPLRNRDELKALLNNHSAAVTIFCGHYHMNDEQELGNIRQITSQSLSFQLVKNEKEITVDNSTFGYRIIEIDKDNIQTQLIHFDNKP